MPHTRTNTHTFTHTHTHTHSHIEMKRKLDPSVGGLQPVSDATDASTEDAIASATESLPLSVTISETYTNGIQSSAVLVSDDVCCNICLSGEVFEDDEIVFCDICNVPVHQTCYGVDIVPKGKWYVLQLSICL
jgi:hypothetical protein